MTSYTRYGVTLEFYQNDGDKKLSFKITTNKVIADFVSKLKEQRIRPKTINFKVSSIFNALESKFHTYRFPTLEENLLIKIYEKTDFKIINGPMCFKRNSCGDVIAHYIIIMNNFQVENISTDFKTCIPELCKKALCKLESTN